MFKKAVMMSLFSVLAVFSLTGCVTVKEYAPQAEKLTVSKEEYELARKLLQAFVKNDADAFVALLPEETQTKFTSGEFAKTRKALLEAVGEPVEYSYLTTLELPALHPQIWKVRFKRWNVNRSKEFTSEILFKVVTGTVKKQAVITGFNFQ